ncbi:DUF3793 family protein [Sedimentibacter saalensis]|uniref:DUF3793 family protein n=1 Tax=Sedimentibacter saalensis TaxID=130788 RepID=UPI0028989911|nr:DUF3793 family protein [Sedimentibacter saalensis]
MELEHILAYHCAPTFAGIKAANLLSLEKFLIPEIKLSFEFYNQNLNLRGIYFEMLCECNERILVIVYRKDTLWSELSSPPNKAFLETQGYCDWSSLDSLFKRLRERISDRDEFPHEIGLFLSYPLEDVLGFIFFKGKNYKCSGYWKVYGNENITKKKFREFTMSRIIFCRKIDEGKSIVQILESA